MNEWRQIHKPHLPWAPSGLPAGLKALPGWAARLASEGRVVTDALSLAARSVLPESPVHEAPLDAPPVLVIPGFGFGDPSVIALRSHLTDRGFRVIKSGIRINVDCGERAVERVARIAETAAKAEGARIDVIGQSRGGMVARGLAATRPDIVRRAICLGSPLADEFAFYELPGALVAAVRWKHQRDPSLDGRKCVTPDCGCSYMKAAVGGIPEDVEIVSMYSKSDGVVDWRSCVLPGAVNVEVEGPHLGMGFNGHTLNLVVAGLRAEIEGQRASLR